MPLTIQFVSDYVCPYCYISKTALEKACEGTDVVIDYLPFELTKETQKPVDIAHDPVRRANWQKTLAPMASKLQLDIKLPPSVSPRPYTRLAHEGYFYAAHHGKGNLYSNRVYKAYFSEEADIGSLEVLKQLAVEIGLCADDFEAALRNGIFRSQLQNAQKTVAELFKISTLPTIRIGETTLSGGVYSEEYFKTLVEKAEINHNGQTVSGAGCGIDSCTF
jgi:predicted DsbA family dithiol-disulfide isomerase